MSVGPDALVTDPPQNAGRRVSPTTARHEAVTLSAYQKALDEYGAFGWSHRLLLELLGDIDEEAVHPVIDNRLALAGRLIAAAQVVERIRLPEHQVRGVVRAWLASAETERDDAAPAVAPRVRPEDDGGHGFAHRLAAAERAGGFTRAAWGVAGTILRDLIRPSVDIARALELRDALRPLVADALPLDASDVASDLTSIVLRLRVEGRVVTDPERGTQERSAAWLRMAGEVSRAHGGWSDTPIECTMERAVSRAADRLAASLVPEEPKRFDHETAVEHAVRAAFDAAVSVLGSMTQPADPIFVRGKDDVLEALLEAAGSALIGAWAIARASGAWRRPDVN